MTEGARWARIRELFFTALELSATDRDAYLTTATEGDEALLAEVQALLSADRGVDGPLDRSPEWLLHPHHAPDTAGTEPEEPDGAWAGRAERIPGLRLLEVIGRGGMGVVYRAEQSEPVRREVAVKLLRSEAGAEIAARFESERQTLAVMEHRSIAQVYDAGSTNNGRPYFVMELIRGEPITAFSDRQRLGPAERVALFVEVCRGVQHAHRKGVIHRDLKPSNLLVTTASGEAHPKIIDFGVAKATEAAGVGGVLETSHGQILGTPQYMSPEQAESGPHDIDTRTDVYALGVVLYELLVGTLPFDRSFFAKPELLLGFLLRDTDAPRPSSRFETLSDAREDIAEARNTSPSALRRELEGDLDWIVMKAMAKERERRYQSASELADDLERYLAGAAVLARPPTIRYRAHRLVRRHRVAAVAAGFAVASLISGTAAATSGALRAVAAEREALRIADRAREDARIAGEIAAFLAELFQEADPSRSLGEPASVRELLDRGAVRVRSQLGGDPRIQAQLMQTIGSVYHSLSLHPEARGLLEEALAIGEREFGPESVEVARVLLALAPVLRMTGESARGAALVDRALSIYASEGEATAAGYAWAKWHVADLALQDQDLVAAEVGFVEALSVLRNLPDQDARHPDLDNQAPLVAAARTVTKLGHVELRKGDADGAQATYRRALNVLERELSPGHPFTLNALQALAGAAAAAGRLAAADSMYRRVLAAQERVYGEGHIATAFNRHQLATIADRRGQRDEAYRLMAGFVATNEAAYGANHPQSAWARVDLAWIELSRGQFADADRLLAGALPVLQREVGADHGSLIRVLDGLAAAAEGQGDLARAESHYRTALQISQDVLGPVSTTTEARIFNLVDLLRRTGRSDEAHQIFADFHSEYGEEVGQGSRRQQAMALRFGNRLSDRDAWDLWIRSARLSVDVILREHGEADPLLVRPYTQLTNAMLGAERPEDATEYARRAVAVLEADDGRTHWELALQLETLHRAYAAAGRPHEVVEEQRRGMRVLREGLATQSDTAAIQLVVLGLFGQRTGDQAAALRHLEAAVGLTRPFEVGGLLEYLNVQRSLVELHRDLGSAPEEFEQTFVEVIGTVDRWIEERGVMPLADKREFVGLLLQYAEVLEAIGREEDAAEIRDRARALGVPA